MTTVVSVAQGGTGSNSAALARTALGVPPSAAYDQANTARTQANTAYSQANSAYGAANTRLSASGGTLAGDLIITGNLTVSGNSTTLNAEILTIEDADIVLLSNVASTPALNAGIIVNRGTSTNTFLRWDEVTDKWGWSDDGSTTYKFTSALDAYAQANSAYGAANNRVLKAGDTMTGQLNISAGGLLVTGNVGFGTASPGAKLHALVVPATNATVDDVLKLTSKFPSVNNAASAAVGSGPAIVFSGGIGDNQTRDRARIVAVYENNNVSGLAFHTQDTADIITEKVRFQNNGNVGIGTTSPEAKLDIQSASGGGNAVYMRGGTYTNISFATGIRFLQPASTINANRQFRFTSGDSALTIQGIDGSGSDATDTNLILQPSGGNVGIGTTTPRGNLDVGTATATAITRSIHLGYSSADFYGFRLTNFNTAASFGAGNFLIQRGNTAAWVDDFAIDNNGNVGIGNSGPGFKFDLSDAGAVISGTATTGSNMKGIRIYNTTTATTNNAIGLWMATGPHQAGIASFRASADTGWDTCLAFYTHVNASSNLNDATEKMRIHGQGYVTMPLQPRFYAYGNVGGTHASGSFVRYGYTYVNVGSHYSSTNGRFTAPVTGDYYLFWGSIGAAASDVYRFYLYKNGADTGVHLRVDTTSTGSEYGTNGSRAIILSLAQNDYVQIYYTADAGTSFYPAADESSPAFTHFGGYLLG